MPKKHRKNSNYQKSSDGSFVTTSSVNITALAMREPNVIVDSAFIELALQDLLSDIEYIEQKYNTVLAGDRADFASARRDWVCMTKGQVAYIVSVWRAGIFKRYAVR